MSRLIGLTGGIAAGKSRVGRELEALGGIVLDADAVAREVVEPGEPAHAAVVEAFGPGIVLPGGGLDRKALGARIFADEAARRALNAIVHPAVRERMARRTAEALASDAPAVFQMIPLLFENDLEGLFEETWLVSTPEATQLERLMGRDGLGPEAARARLAAQFPLHAKLARATRVIDNGGPEAALAAEVRRVWEAAGLPT